MKAVRLFMGLAVICLVAAAVSAQENYKEYVTQSKDFKRVNQSRELLLSGRWDHWILMPWRFRWGKEYTFELAKKMKEAGHNGAFCDHGPGGADIHEKLNMLWYMDHTAGKGDLYLHGRNKGKGKRKELNRPRPMLSGEVQSRMRNNVKNRVARAKKYKTRVAYALDDEISWTSFTSPALWDNSPSSRKDYARWLKERYKNEKALKEQWGNHKLIAWGTWKDGENPSKDYVKRMANINDLKHYWKKPLDKWNLSPWCDRLSYMDSQFLNVVGDLVDLSNSIDPATPCGYVGGQAPAPYGGFDYAKIARKVQYLEAYDIGGNMEIMRSMNPDNMIPTVKTGFGHPAKKEGVWFSWYYMVHGDRGVIAWAERWFGNNLTEKDVMALGPSIQKLDKHSRAIVGGKWKHDGVALYYSHPSVQVSYFMDTSCHGGTWLNRSSSLNNNLASTIAATWSWNKLLEDSRIQYNWISYADVIEKGIDPAEYKVLILPRVLALSKEEADAIRTYVEAGGHVIADHLTGLFDQHGKAYPGGKGILDDLFGIKNRPVAKESTLFTPKTFVEFDQDKYWKLNFIQGVEKVAGQYKREKGLVKAQLDMPCFQEKKTGKGTAVHMNTAVTEYCVIRQKNCSACAAYIKPVTDLLTRAGVKSWLSLAQDGKNPDIAEAVYWEKDGRVVVCVVKNPLKFASVHGETKTEGISKDTVKLTITFDAEKKNVKDEISGKDLGSGKSFTVDWKRDEAAMVSFKK